MFAAILHLSVATHYCGGNLAASRISISGKLATCGMENDGPDFFLEGLHFKSHCCDNKIVYCEINNYYFPTLYTVPEYFNHDFQILSLTADIALTSPFSVKTINTSVSPPNVYLSNRVDLSDICILRI
jgi:hypothetical protein